MEIIITQWALDSYLNLKSEHVFNSDEYLKVIRPDVMLLKKFPHNPKFGQGKFWSAAQESNGQVITNGYKMKWHQVGSGRVQLRLTVGIIDNKCFLCEAYVKHNEKHDKRQLARFQAVMQLIRQNHYTMRGRLS
ncbi:MAG TPA: hypothetical protein PLL67_03375 [Gammaproteobacteria bacterium]|nr:hypothetical protein [Gammaproteobacteria bacterium]